MRKVSEVRAARQQAKQANTGDNGNAPQANGTHFKEEGRKTLTQSNHIRPAPIKQQLELAKTARQKLTAEAKARRNAQKEIAQLAREYEKLERDLNKLKLSEREHALRGVIPPIDLEAKEDALLAAKRSNASKRGARTKAIFRSEKRSIGYEFERDEALTTVTQIRAERAMAKAVKTTPAPPSQQMPKVPAGKVEILDGATLDIFKPEIRSVNPHKARYREAASIIVSDRMQKRVSAKRYDTFVIQTEKTLAEADRQGFGYEVNGVVMTASEAVESGVSITDVWREIARAFNVDGNIVDFPYNYMIRL